MTDTAMIETPKPTRKPARRKKARRTRPAIKPPAAAKPVLPDELAGLTSTECPLECSPSGCVISGRGYCAHPRKGGLQGSDMRDPAALDRAHRAKSALARAMLDKADAPD